MLSNKDEYMGKNFKNNILVILVHNFCTRFERRLHKKSSTSVNGSEIYEDAVCGINNIKGEDRVMK